MIYDLIIIGMGPAGISAAIYAKRAGLNILCIDKSMPGGYLNFIDKIENYPGFASITGPDLAFRMYEQVQKLDIPFKNTEVLDIKLNGIVKEIVTKKEIYKAKYVIIATGRVSRELGLPNEKELQGRGISHCALCDGSLYKDKIVAVVGGGESALQETLYLANLCKKVYLVHRRDTFTADNGLVEKINNKHNVEKRMNCQVTKLNVLNDKLDNIELSNGETLSISCMFTYIGYVPGTKLSLNIMNKDGYIEVDGNYESCVEGVYAVGDIIKKDVYQIVTAVSEGAIAATKIIEKCK